MAISLFKYRPATGPRSAVGNVYDNRCGSVYKQSRGREFDPARSHTFVEIDHEIISTGILLPSADSGAGSDNNHADPDTSMKLGRNVH